MKNQKRWLRGLARFLHKRVRELGLDSMVDPRDAQGMRWSAETLIHTVIYSLMAGCDRLKAVEEWTDQLSGSARKLMKIQRRVPDTTLRTFLCGIDPKEVQKLLENSIHVASRRKAVVTTDLPFGMVAMDGKVTAIADFDELYAQLHHHADTNSTYGLLRTVTACLCNSPGKPCLNAYPIPSATNEMGIFADAFKHLLEIHGEHFLLVSYDAGAASLDNASLVVQSGKHYLFQLADENRLALKMAKELLGPKVKPLCVTEDVITNKRVVKRKLFLHKVYDWSSKYAKDQYFWEHTRTVIRVRSEVWVDNVLETSEDRYFVSSLRYEKLCFSQWLLAVRLHWSVENNCHGTFDRIFQEDEKPWITGDSQGALVVMLFRRLAYNLLSLFRSVSLKSDNHRQIPWKNLLHRIHNACVALTEQHIEGLVFAFG